MTNLSYYDGFGPERVKIKNAETQYTDEQISQFVENRISDNYIAPDKVYAKIQIIIGILIIEKLKLDTSDENNATTVNLAINQFLNELHNSVVKTKNNTNIHSIDSKKSALNSIVETLINKYFSGLEQFRTNFKPLLRLKSLLKHYADIYINPLRTKTVVI